MITELAAKNAKPRQKSYRIGDGKGLYLRVDPTGKKYWIYRFWEEGHERQMSLGPYPDIPLREARERRDELNQLRLHGVSPRDKKPSAPTVTSVATEWASVRLTEKSPSYLRTVSLRLQKYILPAIGERVITDVTSGEVLRLCRKIESQGHIDTAHRVKGLIGQMFRYAIAAGYADTDPSVAITGALTPQHVRHMATVTTPQEIARIYHAAKSYPYPLVRGLLLFSILTFARPGEVRSAEWAELHGDIWDIPAGKMKMRRRHLVPLSSVSRRVLEELRPFSGTERYIFPSPRGGGRCMSENAARVALRAMGFAKETITPHGFRAMASTVLNEQGWNRDVIERQLAHVDGNSVRRAYNHAEYIEQRVKMMEAWASWLESLPSLS